MKKLIIITLTLLTCAHGLYAMDAQSNLTDKLNKDLFAAVKCNNTQQAKTLLEQKADVNATKCDSLLTESGRLHQCCSDVTPLHHAVSLPLQRTVPELELDPTSMVEMLIAHKANVNAVAECPFGKTPLHLAASCNKPIAEILVKTLIKAGALVNAKEKSGDLPLCCALKANSYYAIPPLLEVGAHVDTTIVLQLTPHLHQFLDRTKWMSIHLHTRKLLVTTVCPR